MWSKFGKQVQTFLLIFIVALLSVIMGVVGFGSPSGEGCATDSGPGYAALVYDKTITEGAFNAAYTLTGFNRYPTDRAQALRLREYTLNGLIERELLVREARRLGFTADPRRGHAQGRRRGDRLPQWTGRCARRIPLRRAPPELPGARR